MTNEEAIKVLKQIRQWTDYPKEALTMAIDALSKSSLPINVDEDKLIESELDKKWLVERDMDGNVINGVSEWKDTGSLMNFPAVFNLAKYFYHLGKQNICISSDIDEAAEEYEDNLGYYECMNQWPSVAFKAGAEWMAGQGDVIATRLVIDSEGKVNLNFAIGDITDENCKPKYYTGQDVIVQIRKK